MGRGEGEGRRKGKEKIKGNETKEQMTMAVVNKVCQHFMQGQGCTSSFPPFLWPNTCSMHERKEGAEKESERDECPIPPFPQARVISEGRSSLGKSLESSSSRSDPQELDR